MDASSERGFHCLLSMVSLRRCTTCSMCNRNELHSHVFDIFISASVFHVEDSETASVLFADDVVPSFSVD